MLLLLTGHSPLTIVESLSVGHSPSVTIDKHGPCIWLALPSGQCSPSVTMPFHSIGHAPVATINNTLPRISSSLLVGHSASITIALTGACNLDPFAGT
jgi:hypothetical protein